MPRFMNTHGPIDERTAETDPFARQSPAPHGGADRMARRFRAISILVVVTLGTLFALLSVASAAPLPATKMVSVQDDRFAPKAITVHVGDTVTWTIAGQHEHTVTADNGSFDSGDLKVGEKTSFSVTFRQAGTVAYHCKYHGGPGGVGMSGTVVVQAGAMAAPPSQLPATGGPGGPLGLAVVALALVVTGAVVGLRARQHAG